MSFAAFVDPAGRSHPEKESRVLIQTQKKNLSQGSHLKSDQSGFYQGGAIQESYNDYLQDTAAVKRLIIVCEHTQSEYSVNIYRIKKKKRKKCASRETGRHADAGYTLHPQTHPHRGEIRVSSKCVSLWKVRGDTRVLRAKLARHTGRLLAWNRPFWVKSILSSCGFGFLAGVLELRVSSEVALRAWFCVCVRVHPAVETVMTRFDHAHIFFPCRNHNTAETHNQLCVLHRGK